MLDFLSVDLADKDWMTELFEKGGAPSEEYNFVFAYIWRKTYALSATRMNDFVLVFSQRPTPSYLFPCGKGDLKPGMEAIIQDAKERQISLQLHLSLIHIWYPMAEGSYRSMACCKDKIAREYSSSAKGSP